jgi:hypothetical protein
VLERPRLSTVVNQIPKSSANGAGHSLNCPDAGLHYLPSFSQQSVQVDFSLVPIGSGLDDAQSPAYPAP